METMRTGNSQASILKTMETTTIQLSQEMKEMLATFGNKGDTFEAILRRIYNLAVKEQLREFLMSSEGFIPIDKAIKEAEEKWPK